MVRAIRGTLPARQFATVDAIDGVTYQIQAGSEAVAFHVFGLWAAGVLTHWRDALLVPVPSSTHTTLGSPFTGSKLVEAIAARTPQDSDIAASPVLAFKNKMPRASVGESGGRDRSLIRTALYCESDLEGRSIVLVDDIRTTGAHFLACADFLRERGASVGLALSVACTVTTQHPTPLFIAAEDLEP